MAKANLDDLVTLYEQLKTDMNETDNMITQTDARLNQAMQEWDTKGSHEFNNDWNHTFKPSLSKLCQAVAAAGSDVAFQHNKMAEGAKEADQRPHLAPLHSPR